MPPTVSLGNGNSNTVIPIHWGEMILNCLTLTTAAALAEDFHLVQPTQMKKTVFEPRVATFFSAFAGYLLSAKTSAKVLEKC
jgi:hypothetical protein